MNNLPPTSASPTSVTDDQVALGLGLLLEESIFDYVDELLTEPDRLAMEQLIARDLEVRRRVEHYRSILSEQSPEGQAAENRSTLAIRGINKDESTIIPSQTNVSSLVRSHQPRRDILRPSKPGDEGTTQCGLRGSWLKYAAILAILGILTGSWLTQEHGILDLFTHAPKHPDRPSNTEPGMNGDRPHSDGANKNSTLALAFGADPEANSWFPAGEPSPARSVAVSLNDLCNGPMAESLTFTGLDTSLKIKSNAYGPEFIPFFFDPSILSDPTTFKGLIDFAKPLASSSVDSNNSGSVAAVGKIDVNLQTLAQRLDDISDQFNSQLGHLCGYKANPVNGRSTPVADIYGAILPPEKRPGWQSRDIAQQGEIGLQWLEIDAAELAMDKALQDLDNTLKIIDQKRETWHLIMSSREDMIQNVISATGHNLDQLNKEAILARVKCAEYQARLAKRRNRRNLCSSPLPSNVAVEVASLAGIASLVAAIPDIAINAGQSAIQHSTAGLEIEDLLSQADLERRLREISAKKKELCYLENIGMQFQQIEEDGYRTEEAISSLLLEVKSAGLQTEMAELLVDLEYMKLSTMLNRVAYPPQQHAASFKLVNSTPNVVSLRDYIYRHNNITRMVNEDVESVYKVPFEAQSVTANCVNPAGSTQTSSDNSWKEFLRAHYCIDSVTGVASLKLPFRLTLSRWADSDAPSNIGKPLDLLSTPDRRENTLPSDTQNGGIIFYADAKPEAFGVRIDMLGASVTGIGSDSATVTATLSAEGATYISQGGYSIDQTGTRNLKFQFGRDKRAATNQASVNGVPAALPTPQLHKRSPANDRWVLTISNDTIFNRALLSQLDKIRDIRFSFAISSHTEP